MHSKKNLFICLLLAVLFGSAHQANAQSSNEQFKVLKQELVKQKSEIDNLRSQMNQETYNLNQEIENYSPIFLVLFLYGGFCAVWAQNTGRNAWSWFFLGMILSVLTVITVLVKNNEDYQT